MIDPLSVADGEVLAWRAVCCCVDFESLSDSRLHHGRLMWLLRQRVMLIVMCASRAILIVVARCRHQKTLARTTLWNPRVASSRFADQSIAVSQDSVRTCAEFHGLSKGIAVSGRISSSISIRHSVSAT